MIGVKFIVPLMMAWTSGAAAEFCSLIVRVTELGGAGVSDVPVTIQETGGRIESAVAESGEARFCDLGVLPVTVTVGSVSSCDQTVVHNVILAWGLTRMLKVVYDRAPCRVDGPPPILPCETLLRFVDENSKWVSNVGFNPQLPHGGDPRSDVYGRVMVLLAKHESFRGLAEKPGYKPEIIAIDCSAPMGERERTVVLHKAP